MPSYSSVAFQKRILQSQRVRLQAVLRTYRMLSEYYMSRDRGRATPSVETVMMLDALTEVDTALTRVENLIHYIEPDMLDEEEELGNRIYDI